MYKKIISLIIVILLLTSCSLREAYSSNMESSVLNSVSTNAVAQEVQSRWENEFYWEYEPFEWNEDVEVLEETDALLKIRRYDLFDKEWKPPVIIEKNKLMREYDAWPSGESFSALLTKEKSYTSEIKLDSYLGIRTIGKTETGEPVFIFLYDSNAGISFRCEEIYSTKPISYEFFFNEQTINLLNTTDKINPVDSSATPAFLMLNMVEYPVLIWKDGKDEYIQFFQNTHLLFLTQNVLKEEDLTIFDGKTDYYFDAYELYPVDANYLVIFQKRLVLYQKAREYYIRETLEERIKGGVQDTSIPNPNAGDLDYLSMETY